VEKKHWDLIDRIKAVKEDFAKEFRIFFVHIFTTKYIKITQPFVVNIVLFSNYGLL